MGSINPPAAPVPGIPLELSGRSPQRDEPALRLVIDELRARLDQQAIALRMAAALLQELPLACLVTDQRGRCLDANQAFTRSLETGVLQLATGRVRFDDPVLQQEWETGLLETHVTGIGRSVTLGPPDGAAWNVHLRPWVPLDATNDAQDQRLILAVFEPRLLHAQADADRAAATARLTQAELQVLASLLKGLPAKAIAGLRGASVNTVRSQIMAILEKTGFRSQKELIATFGHSSLESTGFQHSSNFGKDEAPR
jgi:DNA-binding CsgD family transcriptional regulator